MSWSAVKGYLQNNIFLEITMKASFAYFNKALEARSFNVSDSIIYINFSSDLLLYSAGLAHK